MSAVIDAVRCAKLARLVEEFVESDKARADGRDGRESRVARTKTTATARR